MTMDTGNTVFACEYVKILGKQHKHFMPSCTRIPRHFQTVNELWWKTRPYGDYRSLSKGKNVSHMWISEDNFFFTILECFMAFSSLINFPFLSMLYCQSVTFLHYILVYFLNVLQIIKSVDFLFIANIFISLEICMVMCIPRFFFYGHKHFTILNNNNNNKTFKIRWKKTNEFGFSFLRLYGRGDFTTKIHFVGTQWPYILSPGFKMCA